MSWSGAAVTLPELTIDVLAQGSGSNSTKHKCIEGPLDNPGVTGVTADKPNKTKRQKQQRQQTLESLLLSDASTCTEDTPVSPVSSAKLRKLCRRAIRNREMVLDGNMVRILASASPLLQKEMRQRFEAEPYVAKNRKRKAQPVTFPLWTQQGVDVLVPKIPLLEHFPELADGTELAESAEAQASSACYGFDGTLRDYQQPIVQHVLKCLKGRASHSGLLQADPGAGKTCMICNLISELKQPSLVVVHNTKLLEQWVHEVKRWLPRCIVGIYKAKKRPPLHAHVCIASLQTVMRRSFKEPDLERYKAVFIDETHHITARCFSQALLAVQPRYILGCTATLQRTDRLDGWIEVLCGPLLYQLRREVDADVWRVNYVHIEWLDPIQRWSKEKDYVQALTNLCNLRHRTRVIAKVIKKLVQEGRQLICIASRQKLCTDVYHLLTGAGISAGIITGGLTSKDAISQQCLIGTHGMLGEGFNDSKRNTVVLMTPYKGIERVSENVSQSKKRGGSQLIQIVGRGLRAKTQHRPLVVDLVDVNTMFERMYSSRNIYYTQQNMGRKETTTVYAK